MNHKTASLVLHLAGLLIIVWPCQAEEEITLKNIELRKITTTKADKPKEQDNNDDERLIENKSSGAILVNQSLINYQSNVRCSAYAYMFKAMNEKEDNLALSKGVIKALSVVIAHRGDLRVGLDNNAAISFIEAASELESLNPDIDIESTLLDLSKCMLVYLADNNEVYSFLHDQKRTKLISNYVSQPDKPETRKSLNERIVKRLFNVSPSDMLKAQKLVAKISHVDKQSMAKNNNVEVDFDEIQYSLLSLIKRRFETPASSQYEEKLLLNLRVAKEYLLYWSKLNSAKLDGTKKFDRIALAFKNDPANASIAKQMQDTVDVYRQLNGILLELEFELEEEENRKSVEEVNAKVSELDQLFSKIDGSFDVQRLRQIYDLWKLKYHHYLVLDNFINSDLW